MPDTMPDCTTILTALSASDVRFVLIGSLAMAAYGSNDVKQDVDICYGRDAVNLERLASALAPYQSMLRGAPPELPFLWNARTLRAGRNFTLQIGSCALDLVGNTLGIASFETLWAQAVTLEVFGMSVKVASLDDLIAMKRAAGRLKDKVHVMELEALRALVQEGAE